MRAVLNIVLTLTLAGQVFAQSSEEQVDQSTPQHNINTNAVFEEIMQSLSVDVKAEIDSASKSTAATRNTEKSIDRNFSIDDKESVRQEKEAPAAHALEKLPDDVRRRVEKAMSDIDERQKHRQMQFKESRK